MYRYAIEKLKEWKIYNDRKPLIIEGARQVGKTWLMKEFGKTCYKDTAYINFDGNPQMKTLFEGDYNIERIILGLETYIGRKIDPENTLIIFDEVQEVPKALSSLKYFYENAPQYHIVCAGSLLGIALHQGTSFPVGKVDFLNLYPLSFKEFLLALDLGQFAELLDRQAFDTINSFNDTYIHLLKQYYYVGGMPEAVFSFSKEKDFAKVRKIQENILRAYEQDFSKHAPSDIVPKIRTVFDNISSQLAKENKKFIYGLIKEGARAKEFENAIMWLKDCGLIHQVYRVNTPNLPLKAYTDLKAFKLYLLDVGLLSCMVNLNQEDVLLNGNKMFKEFKGALTEQYVLQQLITKEHISTYYYTNEKNSAEIDFIIDNGKEIIPIEVKAEINLMSKSLKTYNMKFNPSISIRTSMANYKKEDWLINLPLYAIMEIDKI